MDFLSKCLEIHTLFLIMIVELFNIELNASQAQF